MDAWQRIAKELDFPRSIPWGDDIEIQLSLESRNPVHLLGSLINFFVEKGDDEAVFQRLGKQLFGKLRRKDFPSLETLIKTTSRHTYASYPGFGTLTPYQLTWEKRWLVIGLATCHPNGRVRQTAIKKIKPFDGEWLPFLLLRINDWVAEVRQIAYAKLKKYLRVEYADVWCANLPLVERLKTCGRLEHPGFIGEVNEFLSRDGLPALIKSCGHRDVNVRRLAFPLWFDADKDHRDDCLLQALGEADLMTRCWAAQKIAKSGGSYVTEEMLEQMKHDSYMPIRRDYFYLMLERKHGQCSELFQTFLADNHWVMRHLARFYWKKINPEKTWDNFYLAGLHEAKGRKKLPYLLGLAEVGAAHHLPQMVPYAKHALPSLRVTALEALRRLGSKNHDGLFLDGLLDVSPRVSATACEAFLDRTVSCTSDFLWQHLQPDMPYHVGKHLLKICTSKNAWDGLIIILKAMAQKQYTELSLDLFQSWINRFNSWQYAPTDDQKNQLALAMTELEQTRPEIYADKAAYLRNYGIVHRGNAVEVA